MWKKLPKNIETEFPIVVAFPFTDAVNSMFAAWQRCCAVRHHELQWWAVLQRRHRRDHPKLEYARPRGRPLRLIRWVWDQQFFYEEEEIKIVSKLIQMYFLKNCHCRALSPTGGAVWPHGCRLGSGLLLGPPPPPVVLSWRHCEAVGCQPDLSTTGCLQPGRRWDQWSFVCPPFHVFLLLSSITLFMNVFVHLLIHLSLHQPSFCHPPSINHSSEANKSN